MAKSSLAVRASLVWCLLVASALLGCQSDGDGAGGASDMSGGACPAQTAMPINNVPGCEAAVAGKPAELHAAAAAVLNSAMTCGFSSCHDASAHSAMLNLVDAWDLNMSLVGKASCEAPTIPLVAAGCGNDALKNSWLWLKLVSPADSRGQLTPAPAWGAKQSCNQMAGDGPFGQRMPWGNGAAPADEASRLAPIRNWICAGAHGPM